MQMHINLKRIDLHLNEARDSSLWHERIYLWDVGISKQQMSRMHYTDVIMGKMTSQTTSLTIVYSTIYSGADHRKHQSSASLAFVRGIHLWPVNSPHKWPVTRKVLPFDDVIMDWNYAPMNYAPYLGIFSINPSFKWTSVYDPHATSM